MNLSLSLTMITAGFVSGLHCLAMCGPLMTMVPYGQVSPIEKWLLWAWYQTGRISTYFILAIPVAFIGRIVNFLELGQWVGLLTGILLIGLFFGSGKRFTRKLQHSITRLIARCLSSTKSIQYPSLRIFVLGALNGMLPCAMVYTAMAITLASPVKAPLMMILFGLSTLPVLFSLQVFNSEVFIRILPVSFFTLKRYIPLLAGMFLLIRSAFPLLNQVYPNTSAKDDIGNRQTHTLFICKPIKNK